MNSQNSQCCQTATSEVLMAKVQQQMTMPLNLTSLDLSSESI
jgi:hypothetical protein